MNRLPGKRSALIPTQREVALILFAAAGGVWLWAVFVDWLDQRPGPVEAQRLAAMAPSAREQVARSRKYWQSVYGPGGSYWRKATPRSRPGWLKPGSYGDGSVTTLGAKPGTSADVAEFMRNAVHRHDGEKWGRS